jgi:hypothetical protein
VSGVSAPLSEQQLAEIAARVERVRAMKFVTGLNAASGHFDTPVERELYTLAATCWNALQAQLKDSDALLADVRALRSLVDGLGVAERTAAGFVGEQGDEIGRLEAEVDRLRAERHSTNEHLDDAVREIRAKEQAPEVVAYRSPQSGSLYCIPCHAGDIYAPVTSEDLPDGGLCAACDVDVLITPAEAGGR